MIPPSSDFVALLHSTSAMAYYCYYLPHFSTLLCRLGSSTPRHFRRQDDNYSTLCLLTYADEAAAAATVAVGEDDDLAHSSHRSSRSCIARL